MGTGSLNSFFGNYATTVGNTLALDQASFLGSNVWQTVYQGVPPKDTSSFVQKLRDEINDWHGNLLGR